MGSCCSSGDHVANGFFDGQNDVVGGSISDISFIHGTILDTAHPNTSYTRGGEQRRQLLLAQTPNYYLALAAKSAVGLGSPYLWEGGGGEEDGTHNDGVSGGSSDDDDEDDEEGNRRIDANSAFQSVEGGGGQGEGSRNSSISVHLNPLAKPTRRRRKREEPAASSKARLARDSVARNNGLIPMSTLPILSLLPLSTTISPLLLLPKGGRPQFSSASEAYINHCKKHVLASPPPFHDGDATSASNNNSKKGDHYHCSNPSSTKGAAAATTSAGGQSGALAATSEQQTKLSRKSKSRTDRLMRKLAVLMATTHHNQKRHHAAADMSTNINTHVTSFSNTAAAAGKARSVTPSPLPPLSARFHPTPSPPPSSTAVNSHRPLLMASSSSPQTPVPIHLFSSVADIEFQALRALRASLLWTPSYFQTQRSVGLSEVPAADLFLNLVLDEEERRRSLMHLLLRQQRIGRGEGLHKQEEMAEMQRLNAVIVEGMKHLICYAMSTSKREQLQLLQQQRQRFQQQNLANNNTKRHSDSTKGRGGDDGIVAFLPEESAAEGGNLKLSPKKRRNPSIDAYWQNEVCCVCGCFHGGNVNTDDRKDYYRQNNASISLNNRQQQQQESATLMGAATPAASAGALKQQQPAHFANPLLFSPFLLKCSGRNILKTTHELINSRLLLLPSSSPSSSSSAAARKSQNKGAEELATDGGGGGATNTNKDMKSVISNTTNANNMSGGGGANVNGEKEKGSPFVPITLGTQNSASILKKQKKGSGGGIDAAEKPPLPSSPSPSATTVVVKRPTALVLSSFAATAAQTSQQLLRLKGIAKNGQNYSSAAPTVFLSRATDLLIGTVTAAVQETLRGGEPRRKAIKNSLRAARVILPHLHQKVELMRMAEEEENEKAANNGGGGGAGGDKARGGRSRVFFLSYRMQRLVEATAFKATRRSLHGLLEVLVPPSITFVASHPMPPSYPSGLLPSAAASVSSAVLAPTLSSCRLAPTTAQKGEATAATTDGGGNDNADLVNAALLLAAATDGGGAGGGSGAAGLTRRRSSLLLLSAWKGGAFASLPPAASLSSVTLSPAHKALPSRVKERFIPISTPSHHSSALLIPVRALMVGSVRHPLAPAAALLLAPSAHVTAIPPPPSSSSADGGGLPRNMVMLMLRGIAVVGGFGLLSSGGGGSGSELSGGGLPSARRIGMASTRSTASPTDATSRQNQRRHSTAAVNAQHQKAQDRHGNNIANTNAAAATTKAVGFTTPSVTALTFESEHGTNGHDDDANANASAAVSQATTPSAVIVLPSPFKSEAPAQPAQDSVTTTAAVRKLNMNTMGMEEADGGNNINNIAAVANDAMAMVSVSNQSVSGSILKPSASLGLMKKLTQPAAIASAESGGCGDDGAKQQQQQQTDTPPPPSPPLFVQPVIPPLSLMSADRVHDDDASDNNNNDEGGGGGEGPFPSPSSLALQQQQQQQQAKRRVKWRDLATASLNSSVNSATEDGCGGSNSSFVSMDAENSFSINANTNAIQFPAVDSASASSPRGNADFGETDDNRGTTTATTSTSFGRGRNGGAFSPPPPSPPPRHSNFAAAGFSPRPAITKEEGQNMTVGDGGGAGDNTARPATEDDNAPLISIIQPPASIMDEWEEEEAEDASLIASLQRRIRNGEKQRITNHSLYHNGRSRVNNSSRLSSGGSNSKGQKSMNTNNTSFVKKHSLASKNGVSSNTRDIFSLIRSESQVATGGGMTSDASSPTQQQQEPSSPASAASVSEKMTNSERKKQRRFRQKLFLAQQFASTNGAENAIIRHAMKGTDLKEITRNAFEDHSTSVAATIAAVPSVSTNAFNAFILASTGFVGGTTAAEAKQKSKNGGGGDDGDKGGSHREVTIDAEETKLSVLPSHDGFLEPVDVPVPIADFMLILSRQQRQLQQAAALTPALGLLAGVLGAFGRKNKNSSRDGENKRKKNHRSAAAKNRKLKRILIANNQHLPNHSSMSPSILQKNNNSHAGKEEKKKQQQPQAKMEGDTRSYSPASAAEEANNNEKGRDADDLKEAEEGGALHPRMIVASSVTIAPIEADFEEDFANIQGFDALWQALHAIGM